jgi:hypothetical protein
MKKGHISGTFLLITFFWYIYQNILNGFEVSVDIEFFNKKNALISAFCKLRLHMRRKRLKKTENLFL